MSFSWQKKLTLVILVVLLAGCGAINKLLEEPFTGPSWDISFDKLPLVPPQTFTIKDLIGDSLGDDHAEDEPLAYTVDLGDIFDFEMASFEIPAIPIAGQEISMPGSAGQPYDGEVTTIDIDFDINGLNWIKFSAGHIEISLENQTDSILDKFTIKLVDSNDVTITSDEINDLDVGETGVLLLDLSEKKLTKKFDLVIWLTTASIGTGNISFEASIEDLEWAEVAIDIANSDMDIVFPSADVEIGLEEIGELLQGTTFDPDAIEFNLIVSNPTSVDLNIDIPAYAWDSEDNILTTSNISFTVPAGAQNQSVPVTGLGELINKFPHRISFSEANLFEGESEIVLSSSFPFSIGMELKINFILSVPAGGTSVQIPPMENDLSGELGEIAGSWIRAAALQFDITNHLPIGLNITVFLSNEDDPYNDINAFTFNIGLPETSTDGEGRVLGEETHLYEITMDSDSLYVFNEPFYVGIELEILNTMESGKKVALYMDDWVEISLWGNIGVRINPQDS